MSATSSAGLPIDRCLGARRALGLGARDLANLLYRLGQQVKGAQGGTNRIPGDVGVPGRSAQAAMTEQGWITRMLAPPSSRWEANAWRKACTCTGLVRTAARLACTQTVHNVLSEAAFDPSVSEACGVVQRQSAACPSYASPVDPRGHVRNGSCSNCNRNRF